MNRHCAGEQQDGRTFAEANPALFSTWMKQYTSFLHEAFRKSQRFQTRLRVLIRTLAEDYRKKVALSNLMDPEEYAQFVRVAGGKPEPLPTDIDEQHAESSTATTAPSTAVGHAPSRPPTMANQFYTRRGVKTMIPQPTADFLKRVLVNTPSPYKSDEAYEKAQKTWPLYVQELASALDATAKVLPEGRSDRSLARPDAASCSESSTPGTPSSASASTSELSQSADSAFRASPTGPLELAPVVPTLPSLPAPTASSAMAPPVSPPVVVTSSTTLGDMDKPETIPVTDT